VAALVVDAGGMSATPRPLSRRERETLEVLLAVEFPGVEALRAQVPGTLVTRGCDCGCPSVELEPPADAPLAAVSTRLPVDASAIDPCGEPEALILLFVDEGRLSYLEYAPTGDRTPARFPPVSRLVEVAPARDPDDEPEADDV
jgi:hypothetical protein